MLRWIIYGLAAYGLYVLFFKDKRIIIEDKKNEPPRREKSYTDYEEL